MVKEVIKGTDDEIEFKGFKGRYFTRLVMMVVGLVGITFLAYGLGFNSLLLFVFMLLIGVGGFFFIQHEMNTNKKYGHIHKQHTPPQSVIQNAQFYKLIKRK